jgi:hypothetical protein
VKKIYYGIYVFLIMAVMLGLPAYGFFRLILAVTPLLAALICTAIGMASAIVGASFICYVRQYQRKHLGSNSSLPLILRDFIILGSSLITIGLGFLSFAGWRCLTYWGGPP